MGLFPRGADPPATDSHATTPPVRLPTPSSLRLISAAGAGGRIARGGASGRKGPREEGKGETGEGGRNGDAWGRPRGVKDTGQRTTVRKMVTTEEGHGHRGHNG